jgi:hypothetical protein
MLWMNRPKEKIMTMTKLGLVGVSTLSLMLALAAPATAQDKQQVVHRARHPVPVYGAYGEPNLPIENALRWGYSQGYSNYPSGFGGLYGDGRYPGNTVSNPGRYNTLH